MVIHRTQIFREAQVDPALRTIGKFLHDKFPKRGVQIDVREAPRTAPQNRYYWIVMAYLADLWEERSNKQNEVPWTKEMAHHMFATKFLPIEMPNGKIMPQSTTKLSVKEFSEYLEQITEFCASRGIELPEPEERW